MMSTGSSTPRRSCFFIFYFQKNELVYIMELKRTSLIQFRISVFVNRVIINKRTSSFGVFLVLVKR